MIATAVLVRIVMYVHFAAFADNLKNYFLINHNTCEAQRCDSK